MTNDQPSKQKGGLKTDRRHFRAGTSGQRKTPVDIFVLCKRARDLSEVKPKNWGIIYLGISTAILSSFAR